MTEGVLSLTKHYVLDRLVSEIARVRAGMSPAEVRDRLQSPHKELFDDLFLYDEAIVVDSVLLEICRSASPGATRVVWVALVAADHRLQRVISEVLTSPNGKLRSDAFSTDALEQSLGRVVDSPSRKAASNLLHYFEQARIVIPRKYGAKIVGIDVELDTRSAVPLSVAYLAERLHWSNPLQQALRLRVNAWLNLTPDEFAEALDDPSIAGLATSTTLDIAEQLPESEKDTVAIPRLDHPYREEDESAGIRLSGTREFDPDVMERASRSHRTLQNLVARWLRERGLTPVSPTEPPMFDVGWWDDDVFWIAEIKSLHPRNESHQIRLGLGQLLDYAHQLARHGVMPRLALAVEREPVDSRWVDLCGEHNVVLTWPPFVHLSEGVD